MHRYKFWAPAIFVAVAVLHVSAQAQQQHFTVKDSIAMQRFTEPDPEASGRVTSFSPDEKFFVVVTTRGLLKENLIESTLWLFDSQAVKKFAVHPNIGRLALPRILARFKGVNQTEPGDGAAMVRSLRWSQDSRDLYFLGRDSTAYWHLYRASISTKKSFRVTPPGQNIASFELGGGRIPYSVALPCPTYPRSRVIVGTGMAMHTLLDETGRISCPNGQELWVSERGQVHQILDASTRKPERINSYYGKTLLVTSPNGRYVVVARAVTDVPKGWERYEPASATRKIVASSPKLLQQALDTDVPEEMVLVNLETGAVVPLIDAPLGRGLQFLGPTEVSWSPEGESVVLTGLMLPLDGVAESKQKERLSTAYAVLCNPQTRSWTVITALKRNHLNELHSWFPETIQTDWTHRVLNVRYTAQGPGPETYPLDRDHPMFIASSEAHSSETPTNPIEVVVRQDLNTPPALFVRLDASTDYKQIWDPNPNFKSIDFGHAEVFLWRDAEGREVHGILIKPTNFQANLRYPLVIEARSYRHDLFIVDGTYATAVAAQAMANDGLMVLQAGEPAVPKNDALKKGTAAALEGYEAAIEKLTGEGLIDPRRVGIIGFSRTCDNVMYAVTRKPDLFAAATIANGFTYGVMGYLESVDASPNNAVLNQWALHYGGNPLGKALEAFKQESELFNLYRVRTPVRVETRSPEWMLTDWETYAGLRALHKPVDLIALPYATHVVSMPADVFASQQGDVDWFRFWLQGYKDLDTEKKDQYERWEQLKEMQNRETSSVR
ncbi:MAG: prolyl oligopeptidase family serine peptidase [Acidobacteriaceae bacterium]|nr:prolyl oligopeptidase family serine peptidase [Acidobacteriaceae bacterium]